MALGRLGVGGEDVGDLHRGHAGLVGDRLENGLDGAIGGRLAAGDIAGIRHVGSRGVQPHQLRAHGAAGDVEDVHGTRAAHPHSPFSARLIVLMRPSRKERVVRYFTAFSANSVCSVLSSTVLPSRLD